MAIRKEIFVTQKRLDPILNVTYKSDLLQIELDVQDFDIPEGTTAIAYAIGESRVVKEEKCSVVGNIISFSPANLFEEGKGLLQIELTNAGKQLSTFKIKVECEGLVKESGVDPSEEMDLTKATVVASDIREGKIAFGSTGEIEGILEEASNPCNIGSGGSVQYLGSTNVSDPFFNVTKKQVGDVIVNTGTTVSIYVDADKFGDADTSDVAAGRTFTSAKGLLLTGTGANGEGIDTSDGTATEEDLREGVVAYSAGKRLVGTTPVVKSSMSYGPVTPDVDSSGTVVILKSTNPTKRILESGVQCSVQSDLSSFGDAVEEDVRAGKTFTSAAGLLRTGTATDENLNAPTVIKKGTITIEESATSIEVDTGLSNIDMITIYKEADTTQNNTNGWIYSDLYTGIMYFSYSTSVSMKYWVEGTRYASISEGIVSAEQRSSSYPVLAGEYSWMAVGTE